MISAQLDDAAEWLLWVDTVEKLKKMKDPENRHKVRCDLEDEEDEEMTRNEALALYRPIRASMRRILSLAVPVCSRVAALGPSQSPGPPHRGWRQADKMAPPKQRHTAKRIFERLRIEHAYAC